MKQIKTFALYLEKINTFPSISFFNVGIFFGEKLTNG
jgi:hypothetical protein